MPLSCLRPYFLHKCCICFCIRIYVRVHASQALIPCPFEALRQSCNWRLALSSSASLRPPKAKPCSSIALCGISISSSGKTGPSPKHSKETKKNLAFLITLISKYLFTTCCRTAMALPDTGLTTAQKGMCLFPVPMPSAIPLLHLQLLPRNIVWIQELCDQLGAERVTAEWEQWKNYQENRTTKRQATTHRCCNAAAPVAVDLADSWDPFYYTDRESYNSASKITAWST